jgi:YjzC-like protein
MQGTSQAEQVFKPGEEVPASGVYTVRHNLHRDNHSATIFKGERFPACARCGTAVRFVLLRRAATIAEESDFQQGQGQNA